SATLSSSADFPVLPVIRPTQLPPLSQRDEEGFSSCSMCPCRHAVANHPAGAARHVNRPVRSCAAFALTVAGSASGSTHFRGHLAFTCVTAWQLAPIPRMGVSRGFRFVGFPPACPPSDGASDSYPGRTNSCWTQQPSLDAQPDVQVSPHPAQALENAPCGTRRTPPRSTPLRYSAGADNGTVGSRTSKSFARRRHVCFAPSSRLAKRFTYTKARGKSAGFRRGVMSLGGSTPIQSASAVQPAWAWLWMYASAASRWASSELKSWSSPSSVLLRVYTAQRTGAAGGDFILREAVTGLLLSRSDRRRSVRSNASR